MIAPGVHQERTRIAPGVHQDCTRIAPGLHQDCTRIAPGVHQECQRSALGVRQECTRRLMPQLLFTALGCIGHLLNIIFKDYMGQMSDEKKTKPELKKVKKIVARIRRKASVRRKLRMPCGRGMIGQNGWTWGL